MNKRDGAPCGNNVACNTLSPSKDGWHGYGAYNVC